MADEAVGSEVDAIRNTFSGLVSVAEAGNPDGWFDFIADDAVYLLPGFPPIAGAKAIRDFVAGFLKEWWFSFPKWTIDEIVVSGNLAIYRYSGVATMTAKDGSETVTEDRKYVDVYRKTEDGRWLLACHMYNLNQ
jgi:uncharacterized protein (TIGR02246 family)